MTMTDPIADMLTRIRNAHKINALSVSMPYSKTKESIAKVLLEEGYIKDIDTEEIGEKKSNLTIGLKYFEGKPVISEIKRVSTPGRRVYSSINDLPRTYNGLGISILSTPRGVMSDNEARAAHVGGEVLCQVF